MNRRPDGITLDNPIVLLPKSPGVVAQIGDLEKGLCDIRRSRRGQRLAGRHDRSVVECVVAIAARQLKEEFDGKSVYSGRGGQAELRRRHRTETFQLECRGGFAEAGAALISQLGLVQIAGNLEQVAELDVPVARRRGGKRVRVSVI